MKLKSARIDTGLPLTKMLLFLLKVSKYQQDNVWIQN